MSLARRLLIALCFWIGVLPLAQAEEPVYVEFVRTLKPLAHFRLDGTDPALAGLAQGATAPVQVVSGPSPADRVEGRLLNGFEDGNRSLRFQPGPGGGVILPGAALPDFALPHEDALTISVWVRGDAEQVNRAGIVARKAAGGSDDYQFAINLWSNTYDAILSQPDGSFRAVPSYRRPTGEWQHLVLVLDNAGRQWGDAGAIRFYFNGQQTGLAATKNSNRTQLRSCTNAITIGGLAYGQKQEADFNRSFSGCIDELTFWNRALSADEVQQLFNAATISRKPMVIMVGSTEPGEVRGSPL